MADQLPSSYANNSEYYDPYDHNTKWADIDVHLTYQFDHQPTNITMTGSGSRGGTGGRGANGYYNDLYQISFRLQNKQLKGWQSWMNWFEKIQPDYKFLVVDQKNSQTVVFQNVDDPWMFTQYIYKGIGKIHDPYYSQVFYQKQYTEPPFDNSELDYFTDTTKKSWYGESQSCKATNASYLVIQPALYDYIGYPMNKAAFDLDNKYFGGVYTIQQTDESKNTPIAFKKVRQLGWYNSVFGQYQKSRYTTGADGSILYRGQICVQCNKWGQHGNVPAHAVNMIAPKDYVQGNTKLVLRAVQKTTLGIPVYVDPHKGYIMVKNGKYYVHDISVSPDHDQATKDSNGMVTRLATVQYIPPSDPSTGNQIIQNFTKSVNPTIKCKLVGTDITAGQVIYNGCKYFGVVGTENNKILIGCTLDKSMTLQQRQYAKCCQDCKDTNKECKYFIKRGKTVAFRYQCLPVKQQNDDNSDWQLQQLAMVGLATGTMVGADLAIQSLSSRNKNKNYISANVTSNTQTTFQYIEQPLNGIEVYLPPNSQNNKGAVIKRGTGQSAFQKPGLPVRSIYDGDMSQINYHRWLNRLLPCYNKKFCNQTVGPNYTQNIPNYVNSGCSYMEINDNGQILNKTAPYCPYYNLYSKLGVGCPYSTVNKTAMDYARTINAFYESFYSTALSIANYFINNIHEHQQNTEQQNSVCAMQNIYAKKVSTQLDSIDEDGNGIIVIYVYYSFYKLVNSNQQSGTGTFSVDTNQKNFVSQKQAIIWLSNTYGLQQEVLQKSIKQDGDNKLFFLCTIRVKVEGYHIAKKRIDECDKSNEYGDIKRQMVDLFIRYNAYDLGEYSQTGASKPNKVGQWFVRVDNTPIPIRDPFVIDNQIKFLGGYHPQYSAYPSSPQQILYKKEVPYDEQFVINTKSDEDEYGNSPTGANKQVQYGYFVKQTGDWLMDEQSVGTPITDQNVQQSIDYRAETPTSQFQGGTNIGNKWENSQIDPQAQKPKQKKIVNCIFYTNDTQDSINYLRQNPPTVQDEDGQQQRKVPVRIVDEQALPLQRDDYAYCSNCDTVLALRFLSIVFSNPPQDQIGENGRMRCPWCGNELQSTGKGIIEKLPRTKAMGRVVFWGLPGTVVKTDSYFWKSPVTVNNALISQMMFKLGAPSEKGGGYSYSGDSSQTAKIDSVPFMGSVEQFKQVGVYRQGVSQNIYDQYYKESSSAITSSSFDSDTNSSLVTGAGWFDNPNRIATNPNLPKHILYETGIEQYTDNRIINPFEDGDNQGLRMISADYITSLRNRLQPVLGYYVGRMNVRNGQSRVPETGDILSDQSHSPNHPGQYQLYRVKYDDRKQLSHIKYWVKKRCACAPLILAYCGDQNQQTHCKLTYPSGDKQTGNLCKYYPQDPKWWFNKQLIGGIYTSLSGNPYHFDRENFSHDGLNKYGGMKGDPQLCSQCYILPHGFIPLDKQVVAAYLYFNARQQTLYEPSIGQIQYPSGKKVTLYLHFHPYCTQHEEYGKPQDQNIFNWVPHKHEIDDNLVYDNGENLTDEWKRQHNIFDADDIGPLAEKDINEKQLISYVDKFGDKYYIDNKTGLPIYERMFKQKHPQYFIQTQDIHQFKWLQDNLPYTCLAKQINMADVATGINYTHQKKDFGTSKLPDCIKWNGFGTDIIQTKSQNQIWKNYTKAQFEKMEDRYLSHVTVQIDSGDGNATSFGFNQYYSEFNSVLQQQMQAIPGYFDLSNFNSSGYLKPYQKKSSKSTNIQGNYQQFIITQASVSGDYDSSANAGQGDVLHDITPLFKDIYKQRVERHYQGRLSSKSIYSIADNHNSIWNSDNKQSQLSANWSNYYNKRKKHETGYYMLNTNYWYPKLNDDGVIDTSINGQKIEFETTKLMVSNDTKSFYNIGSSSSICVTCTVKVGTITSTGSATQNFTIQNSEANIIDSNTLVGIMNSAINNAKGNSIVAQESRGNIVINIKKTVQNQKDIFPNVSFTFTGLGDSTVPTFKNLSVNGDCNRVISFSGFKNGFHPKLLTNFVQIDNSFSVSNYTPGSWFNITLNQQPQYIVFDLIQPPFQKQRRDYLKDKGSTSYQQSRCNNQNCDAYNQLQGIYAKTIGTHVNKNCVKCGLQLEGVRKDSDGINSWWYQDMLEDDVVIAGLQMKFLTNKSDSLPPFSIYVSSDNKQWQCILSLIEGTNHQYQYSSIYETNNTSTALTMKQIYDDLNLNFLGNLSQTATTHGKLIRGRYLKIVSIPQPYTQICTAESLEFQTNYITFPQQQINKLYVSDGELAGQLVTMQVLYAVGQQEYSTATISRSVLNNIGNQIYIQPVKNNSNNGAQISNIKMQVTLYWTGIQSLQIYGGGYSSKELIITPKPNRLYGDYNYIVPINKIPLQFFKVAACISSFQQIPLTQLTDYNEIEDVGFELQVVEQFLPAADFDDNGGLKSNNKNYRHIKYYRIKGGYFYFDIGKKRLLLPRYGYCSSLILEESFGKKDSASVQNVKLRDKKQFEQKSDGSHFNSQYKIQLNDLGANLQKWGIYKQLLPTNYSVVMWDGTQGGVQVQVEAAGKGPSYQVEKGAICQIASTTAQILPKNGPSIPLPTDVISTYESYQQVNQNVSIVENIPWIVYNRQLASIPQKSSVYENNKGKFGMTLLGTELYGTGGDYWYEHIVGRNCQNFTGIVKSSVILKGKPNTCLYIRNKPLDVFAPELKIRHIGSTTVTQRTGGLVRGLCIRPQVSKATQSEKNSSSCNRVSNAYMNPYIIVYMKQRYIDDPLE